MAYVLVMHLSPNHKSALAEILQTKTKMKVHTVKNGMEVMANHVYVIPPNTFMSLVDGHLKLAPRSLTAIGNFAVDYFLTALASIYKNNSVGVILSGTATDGTLGMKAIKAEGGITFAQDQSAKFPDMPKNAYDSGYADFMLSPAEIAKELARFVKLPHTKLPANGKGNGTDNAIHDDQATLKKILHLVLMKTGVDFFQHYKQASVHRRIVRRMTLKKVLALDDYLTILQTDEAEIAALYNDFLINVTHFFRDPDFFRVLVSKAFRSILTGRKTSDPVRIWVPGCATGEEAYSIAITLMEYLEEKEISMPFQIFASDLDGKAIEKARIGIYPLSALQNVKPQQLKRYFKKVDSHFQIAKHVREACVFSRQNLLNDPPFSRMDIISCQNVLIYLESEPQRKILQVFHYALKPSGYLFLGKSETIGAASELFDPLDRKIRIYSRKDTGGSRVDFSTRPAEALQRNEALQMDRSPQSDIEREVSKLLIARFVSPCVVLNQSLNIIQFYGITAPYLAPGVGKASLNVLKMIREDLLVDLRTLLQQAKKTQRPVAKERIPLRNQKVRSEIGIEVIPRKIEQEIFFLVVFKETQAPTQKEKGGKKPPLTGDKKQKVILRLEEELLESRELIRTTNEEYETTYEELQANNEEILSSNEELQSVNEELETSKEELQSANEELTTINEELQKRNVELKESQNYAQAIVDTVNSPFLVLTANLQVRLANKSFYDTFKQVAEKTEGKFIYELGEDAWDIPELRNHLNALLARKTSYLEFEFRHFFPRAGELFFNVNAYRLTNTDREETLLLLAFNNVSDLQLANRELKSLNEQLEQFVFISSHDLREPLRKIETFANYLADHKNLDAYEQKYVEKINATTVRMSTLLKDLLRYFVVLKGVGGQLELVDINLTIKNVLRDLELLVSEKNAAINTNALPVVKANPPQMDQLFYNLISNALKFSNGQSKIDVTGEEVTPGHYTQYGLRREKQYACIRVRDNGIGFDQKYVAKIFNVFSASTTNPKRAARAWGWRSVKKLWLTTAASLPQRDRRAWAPPSGSFCRRTRNENQRFDTFDQFVKPARFRNERNILFFGVLKMGIKSRAEHYDGHMLQVVNRSNGVNAFVSIHFGHVDVNKNEVGCLRMRTKKFQRLLAAV